MEFALVLPVLMLLIFGIIQYGYYFFAAQNGSSVLREAARKVAVGDCPTQAALESFIKTRLNSTSYSNFVVTRTYTPSTPTIGGKVTMTLVFDTLDMNMPLIPVPGNATVAREVDARIEDLTPGTC